MYTTSTTTHLVLPEQLAPYEASQVPATEIPPNHSFPDLCPSTKSEINGTSSQGTPVEFLLRFQYPNAFPQSSKNGNDVGTFLPPLGAIRQTHPFKCDRFHSAPFIVAKWGCNVQGGPLLGLGCVGHILRVRPAELHKFLTGKQHSKAPLPSHCRFADICLDSPETHRKPVWRHYSKLCGSRKPHIFPFLPVTDKQRLYLDYCEIVKLWITRVLWQHNTPTNVL